MTDMDGPDGRTWTDRTDRTDSPDGPDGPGMAEDKHWCFTPIVFLRTSKGKGGVFARVVNIFEQKGWKQKSWVLAKEPHSEAAALRNMSNYKNMNFKLDVHEVDFASSCSIPGRTAWASPQEGKAKTAYCTFGSHVHMLPGQNIFPREVPEEEQKVEDPLLHLYTNVANFLGAERDLHADGVKPFEDELSLLAVLNALEILRLHGRNIFQVHLRSSNMKAAIGWLDRYDVPELKESFRRLKATWAQRKSEVSAW